MDTFFIRKKRTLLDIITALVCIYFLNIIKAYVLVCVAGASLFWYSYNLRKNIKSALTI